MGVKQVLVKQGQVVLEEVPAPFVEQGSILVKVDHSCISIGTEMSGIKSSGLPLWEKALRQPENVQKVLNIIASQGISKAKRVIDSKLQSGSPTGYSAAGTVLEVGEGIDDIQPGDRVACAGAQCAYHAEIICVPRNLAVKVPDNLDFEQASTVTLGSIAMQGVRRASPTLGETFVVIGLGILGQLTAQLLKVNGCRVIGTDLDRNRIAKAKEMGMDVGIHPDDGFDIEQVIRLTDNVGADGVIITAATPSDAVVSTAFRMCRKKGRVVLVGDVGLNLNREDFYQKELDFFISSSYGPGRYDHNYEEKGLDYPVAFVRWTENRNLAEFIRLLSEKKVNVRSLIDAVYPIEQASEAYNKLKTVSDKPLMVLLSYQRDMAEKVSRVIRNPLFKPSQKGRIRIAIVGAGGFAKGMHLPNIKDLNTFYQIQAIASRTGNNAIATAKQYGAKYATTDYQQILADPEIDAVLIATRHNLHTSMTLAALKAGKHVLVEKPLAISREELESIQTFYQNSADNNPPILLTGFNRRFSCYGKRIFDIVKNRSNPMIMNYRINAGYIPLDHWVHSVEGGGRNIGEACHIYDLFTFLTNSKVKKVNAQAITPKTNYYGRCDNFVATVEFEDGSLATLTYTALGSMDYPKEQLEIYVDGTILKLNDYQQLTIFGRKTQGLKTKIIDKGQKDELIAFAEAIQSGEEWPIPLWQQEQAMEISFEVEKYLSSGKLIG
jgi:predicted dehydrogenase/threonine dehydrogenase-like Zn-dependent dehydrogenase